MTAIDEVTEVTTQVQISHRFWMKGAVHEVGRGDYVTLSWQQKRNPGCNP